MTDKLKEEFILNLLEELIGKGNLEVIEEAFASDYIAHAGGKLYKGNAFLKRFSKQLRAAIPNVQVLDVEFLVHKGDRVSWQRTLSGTNTSNLQGIPASNKKVKWVEMVVTRFEDGKISEEWLASGLMGELLLKAPRS